MNLETITDYLKKSFNELKKVNWLTRKETFNLTLEVIVFALVFIIIYGIVDSFLVRIILLLK